MRKPRRPRKEIIRRTKKIENAGYRTSERKSEFFKNRMKWLGHESDEDGIKSNKEKVKAILELKHPENPKQSKSFLGAIQYLAKFLPRMSERTDRLRKLLQKNTKWRWETEQQNDFETIKNVNQRTGSSTLCKR